jgi:hypothetical protein
VAIGVAIAGFLASIRMIYRLFAVVPLAVPGYKRRMVLLPRTIGGDSFRRFNEPPTPLAVKRRRPNSGKFYAIRKFLVKAIQA